MKTTRTQLALLAALTGTALFVPLTGFAEDAPAAAAATAAPPAPPYTLTTNVNLVTDYYFRGITQTWHKPAIQGGADYVHSSGWYAGIWGSNVTNNTYPGGSALEFDYYGGYNGKITDDFGWTAGVHGYAYPGADFNKNSGATGATPSVKYDTFEWNAGLSYQWASVKYSRQLTNWFGADKGTGFKSDSKGSSYLEGNIAYEFMPTWTLNLHAAHTDVKAKFGTLDPSYNDYLLGVTKGFEGGWSAQAAYAKSSYKANAFWKPTASLANATSLSDPGEGRLILTVGRTF